MTEDNPDIIARVKALELLKRGHRLDRVLVDRYVLGRRKAKRIQVLRCTICFQSLRKSMYDGVWEGHAGRRTKKPGIVLCIPCKKDERRRIGRDADERRQVSFEVLYNK
jgi:hypothetical protein